MSILIHGMEMPQNCTECHVRCRLYLNGRKFRHPNCPLIEVLTPHGRLIDADKLSNQKYENIWTNRLIIDADDLDDVFTVIEAEGET